MNVSELTGVKITPPAVHGIHTAVYNGRSENEVSTDTILPDHMPDLKKMLMVTARTIPDPVPLPVSGRADYGGNVVFTAVFETEEGKMASLSSQVPYSCSCDIPESKCAAAENLTCEILSDACEPACRVINSRKLNFKCRLRHDISVYGRTAVTPTIVGTVTADDEMSLETDFLSCETLNLLHAVKNDIAASCDMEIEAAASPAVTIIWCRPSYTVTACHPQNGYVELEGEATINCLYLDEAGQYVTLHQTSPLSCDLDMPGLHDGCKLMARLIPGSVRASLQNNSFGENKIVEIDSVYSAEVWAAENTDGQLTRDMYSTAYECENKYADTELSSLLRCSSFNFTVNASVPRSESGASEMREVIAAAVSLSAPMITPHEGTNRALYEAEASVAVTGLTAEVELTSANFNFPVKSEFDAGIDPSFPYTIKCLASPVNVRGRLEPGAICADFEIMLDHMTLGSRRVQLLSSCTLTRDKPVDHSGTAPVMLYYPQPEESLWEIARHYKTTRHAIAEANGLQEDRIGSEHVILIPRLTVKKTEKPASDPPLFTGIIEPE